MKSLLLIVVGAIIGAAALFLFLSLSPASSKSGNTKAMGTADVKVTIYEPYLNKLASRAMQQKLTGQVSAMSLDVKPGNTIIVSLKANLSGIDAGSGMLGTMMHMFEKAKKGPITLRLVLRASVAGGQLRFRVEEIKLGKLPVQRKMLVGPLGAMVSSVEQQMNGEVNARLRGTEFTPIGVDSDEGSLTVYFRGK